MALSHVSTDTSTATWKYYLTNDDFGVVQRRPTRFIRHWWRGQESLRELASSDNALLGYDAYEYASRFTASPSGATDWAGMSGRWHSFGTDAAGTPTWQTRSYWVYNHRRCTRASVGAITAAGGVAALLAEILYPAPTAARLVAGGGLVWYTTAAPAHPSAVLQRYVFPDGHKGLASFDPFHSVGYDDPDLGTHRYMVSGPTGFEADAFLDHLQWIWYREDGTAFLAGAKSVSNAYSALYGLPSVCELGRQTRYRKLKSASWGAGSTAYDVICDWYGWNTDLISSQVLHSGNASVNSWSDATHDFQAYTIQGPTLDLSATAVPAAARLFKLRIAVQWPTTNIIFLGQAGDGGVWHPLPCSYTSWALYGHHCEGVYVPGWIYTPPTAWTMGDQS